MKILLIYPKTNPYPHTVSTPLSIFSIGSYLENNSVEVNYFDERIQSLSVLNSFIREGNLLVGISTMTGYQIKRGLAISQYIKGKNKAIPICWGGTHPSMLPEQTLLSKYIDYVIKGEGEESLFELYKALAVGENSLFGIKGLYWKKNGEIIANLPRPFLDVNKLPSPYESNKIKNLLKEFYLKKKNKGRFTFGYEVSRGCLNNCAFCYIPIAHKNSIRIRKKELYKKDMEELKSLGIDGIFFYDNHISINAEFLKEFCQVMKELNLEWTGGFRTNYLKDKATVEMLEASKCLNLFFGLESIEDEILKLLRKGQTYQLIKNAVDLLNNSSIRPTYSFLTGLPLERDVNIEKLLDFVDDIVRNNPKAEIAIQPYTPLPGSELFQKSIEKGFKAPERLEDYWWYATGDVVGPWVKNKGEILNLFLVSFLIFRTKYFLNKAIFWPLVKLSEIRWKKRFFKIPIERLLFNSVKLFTLCLDDLKWLISKFIY